MITSLFATAGLVLAATATCCVITYQLARRSMPDALAALVDSFDARLRALESEWDLQRTHLAALVESLEDVHTRVKRAKTSQRATLQRIEMAEDGSKDPRDALRRKAGLL